jgi:hypothetical protein
MKRRFFLLATFCPAFFALPLTGNPIVESKDVSSTTVETYHYPRIIPRSSDYKVFANDQEVLVYQTSAGPFAAFSCDGAVQIEVKLPRVFKKISISPARHGIEPQVEGDKLRFKVPGPTMLAVMVDEHPVLYVYANPLEQDKPDPADPSVKYFKAGQVHEVGQLRLQSNETLYIEGGAVVRGSVIATSAENVKISGHGVLDGGYYKGLKSHRSIIYEGCRNSVVENIIMIEPTSWMIVLGLSEHITVRGVKQLGYVSTSDGVDIVGSRHILVENCFLRNGDDCIAIKAFDMGRYEKSLTLNLAGDVEDVEVRGCIALVNLGGSAFEIGHELTTGSVKNIRFRDCDVLGAHDQAGVFGIHNTDRAVVSNILYEDIRVEHYYNKLIDLRVIKSRYHRDEQRGQIRDVVFRNINVTVSPYNPGYSVSIIGGYNAKHTVENVLFDNFRLNDEKVLNGDQLDLFVKQVKGIRYK